MLPTGIPAQSPLPADFVPRRTPQFEIWRSVDTQPFIAPFRPDRTDSIPVRIPAADAFVVQLVLPGLHVGATVFAQDAGAEVEAEIDEAPPVGL